MKLYYYEHCPYCIRVLLYANARQLNLAYEVLPNDDEATPISLINQKMLPILLKPGCTAMPESLDIISFLEESEGATLGEYVSNSALEGWLNKTSQARRVLTYPRMILYPFKEFETEASRSYFEKKKEKSVGSFAQAISETEQWCQVLEPLLPDLTRVVQPLIGEAITWDDIHLFPHLYLLRLVPSLNWPTLVKTYLDDRITLGRFTDFLSS